MAGFESKRNKKLSIFQLLRIVNLALVLVKALTHRRNKQFEEVQTTLVFDETPTKFQRKGQGYPRLG